MSEIETFGFDPTTIGLRYRYHWIITEPDEDDRSVGAQPGYLCVKARDGGGNEPDPVAFRKPNYFATAEDSYDRTYRYYWFKPLAAPAYAAPAPAEEPVTITPAIEAVAKAIAGEGGHWKDRLPEARAAIRAHLTAIRDLPPHLASKIADDLEIWPGDIARAHAAIIDRMLAPEAQTPEPISEARVAEIRENLSMFDSVDLNGMTDNCSGDAVDRLNVWAGMAAVDLTGLLAALDAANARALAAEAERDAWKANYDNAAERLLWSAGAHGEAEARALAAEAERDRMKAALEEERTWHEAEDKGLSKQPPSSGPNGTQWARHQHRERIEAITAALAQEPSPAALSEPAHD